MAGLIGWIISNGLSLFVGVCVGAGGLKAGEAVIRKITKGKFFGPVPATAAKPKA